MAPSTWSSTRVNVTNSPRESPECNHHQNSEIRRRSADQIISLFNKSSTTLRNEIPSVSSDSLQGHAAFNSSPLMKLTHNDVMERDNSVSLTSDTRSFADEILGSSIVPGSGDGIEYPVHTSTDDWSLFQSQHDLFCESDFDIGYTGRYEISDTCIKDCIIDGGKREGIRNVSCLYIYLHN